jgi:WXG100 family type VII secretion target
MSAGQGFEVESVALVTGATNCDAANEDTNGVLTQLRNALYAQQDAWQDEASVSFHTVMERYQEAESKLGEALRGIAEVLRQSAANYDEAEGTNAEGFTRMTGAFPV